MIQIVFVIIFLKNQLQEERRQLENQIDEIEEAKEVNTEKGILLRNLRAKKREVKRELSEALVNKSETEYKKEYNKNGKKRRIKLNQR